MFVLCMQLQVAMQFTNTRCQLQPILINTHMYVRILQQTTLVAVKCSVVVYMVHMVQLGIHLCAWGGLIL